MTTRMVDDSAGLVSDSAVEGALASGLSHVDNPRHRTSTPSDGMLFMAMLMGKSGKIG